MRNIPTSCFGRFFKFVALDASRIVATPGLPPAPSTMLQRILAGLRTPMHFYPCTFLKNRPVIRSITRTTWTSRAHGSLPPASPHGLDFIKNFKHFSDVTLRRQTSHSSQSAVDQI